MIKIEKLWVTRTLQFLLVIIEPILRGSLSNGVDKSQLKIK